MQPDIGTVQGFPQNQFAFNRSYVKAITADFIYGVSVYIPGMLTFFYPPGIDVTEVVIFRDYFHNWSSNSYTLDGIVQSIQYFFNADPLTLYPGGIYVRYEVHGYPPTPMIVVNPVSYDGLLSAYPLPGAPDDYWVHI